MKNVALKALPNIAAGVRLVANLSKNFGLSSSGKTELIATGKTPLGLSGATVQLNVFKKPKETVKLDVEVPDTTAKGLTYRVRNQWLEIDADFSSMDVTKCKPSASGKTTLLFATGNVKLPTNVTFGFNCYLDAGEAFDRSALFLNVRTDDITKRMEWSIDLAGLPVGKSKKTKGFMSLDEELQSSFSVELLKPLPAPPGGEKVFSLVGRNIYVALDGSRVVFQTDPQVNDGLSASGKSISIGSSVGAKKVLDDTLQITINVIRPADEAQRAAAAKAEAESAPKPEKAPQAVADETPTLPQLDKIHQLVVDYLSRLSDSQREKTKIGFFVPIRGGQRWF